MGRHPHNVGDVRKKSKNPLGKAGDSGKVRAGGQGRDSEAAALQRSEGRGLRNVGTSRPKAWRDGDLQVADSRAWASIWDAHLDIFLTVPLFYFIVVASLTHKKAWRHP